MNNDQKLCEITDIIPVRIFPDRGKKLGPIKPMLMSNSLIYSILNSRPSPKHFFALNPNNPTRKILLTKDNYNKTSEELFGIDRDTHKNVPNNTINVPKNENTTIDKPSTENVAVETNDKPILEDTTNTVTKVDEITDSDLNVIENESNNIESNISETIIDMNDIDISNMDTNNNNQYKSKKNRKNR